MRGVDTFRKRSSLSRLVLAFVGTHCALLATGISARAQSEISPLQTPVAIDWAAAAHDLSSHVPKLVLPPAGVPAGFADQVDQELAQFAVNDKEAFRPVATLNVLIASAYPDIGVVPVPILAPIDTVRFFDRIGQQGLVSKDASSSYLASSVIDLQFVAKSSGYDALARVNKDVLKRLRIANTDLVTVHLGASGLLYETGPKLQQQTLPAGVTRVADKQLLALYPDIKRHLGADDITYSFRKYGVPYFASIACETRGGPPTDVIACSQVDQVMRLVLLDLRFIGGTPKSLKRNADACGPRPDTVSPLFKFYPPGNLPNALSQGGAGGVGTKLCWAPGNFIFPLKDPQAYANTQIFLHSGDCGGNANKINLPDGRYKCRQNPTKILEKNEGHEDNYSYPWRDTYCEVRNDNSRNPPKCPQPIGGHEGQDIRPKECRPNGLRCQIDLFDVVAVTRGKAMWTEKNHIRLIADDGTGLYYMYLHMTPESLQKAGMRRGQLVAVGPGTKLGKVGNRLGPAGDLTTAHLHFEIREQSGALCAGFGCTSSPYWTLIRAYEHLIGMRGTEIAP